MLDAIKHIRDDNFFFQEGSAQVQCVCNTIQLSEILDPVVDRVERTDRLGCFVDRLDRLHRLVDDFTTRLG